MILDNSYINSHNELHFCKLSSSCWFEFITCEICHKVRNQNNENLLIVLKFLKSYNIATTLLIFIPHQCSSGVCYKQHLEVKGYTRYYQAVDNTKVKTKCGLFGWGRCTSKKTRY